MTNSLQTPEPKRREIEIDISSVFRPFGRHLQGNKRIFFSGKFGSGKTYFLSKFFEKNTDQYDVFHLYPIRYQISANEDIKDLLKYDILLKLQEKKADIFSDKNVACIADWGRLLYLFAQGNKREIFACGLNIAESVADFPIPFAGQQLFKLGRPIGEVASLVGKFNDFKERIVNGEAIDVRAFLKRIADSGISDEDPITSIIRENISGPSEADVVSVSDESSTESVGKKKESVLILDDLDRLDPEHIFRILNVFSAHLGMDSEPNPFGFDKVILVGDVRNIRSIFHHRYGPEADFSGYFDKFFEAHVYDFAIDDVLKSNIPIIMKSFRVPDEKKTFMDTRNGFTGLLLSEILDSAVRRAGKERLTIRMMLKPTRYEYQYFSQPAMRSASFNSRDLDVAQSLDDSMIFLAFLGGKEWLLSLLKEKSDSVFRLKDFMGNNRNSYVSVLLRLLDNTSATPVLIPGTVPFGEYDIEVGDDSEVSGITRRDSKNPAPELLYVLLSKYVTDRL